MRIFVTGANGFIGSAFVRTALGAGHEVLALVRAPERVATLASHPALRIVTGTLAEPPWAAIERFAPTTCLHAAWITQPADYRASDENARLQLQSVALARELLARGVRRLVVLGTCEEYAPGAGTLHETRSRLAPVSAYARAKHELRLALQALARDAGARMVWARIFQPFGPGEHAGRLLSLVIAHVKRGEPLRLRTPAARRDWIHVEDVATALLCLVERDAEDIVNIGTGQGHTVGEVACSLAKLLGRVDLVTPLPSEEVDLSDSLIADPGRLHELGWRPAMPMVTRLQLLIEQTR